MNKVDPELDLLIVETLGSNYRSAVEIASQLGLDVSLVESTLDELISHGFTIEKKDNKYRALTDELVD